MDYTPKWNVYLYLCILMSSRQDGITLQLMFGTNMAWLGLGNNHWVTTSLRLEDLHRHSYNNKHMVKRGWISLTLHNHMIILLHTQVTAESEKRGNTFVLLFSSSLIAPFSFSLRRHHLCMCVLHLLFIHCSMAQIPAYSTSSTHLNEPSHSPLQDNAPLARTETLFNFRYVYHSSLLLQSRGLKQREWVEMQCGSSWIRSQSSPGRRVHSDTAAVLAVAFSQPADTGMCDGLI